MAGGYPEDPTEPSAPQPPRPRPRPSRPPWPPRPPRPTPPPKHTHNPRVFKFRYFYNGTSFGRCPFQKSHRPQTPPEAPEIVNKNPWTLAQSDRQKESEIELQKLGESSNSEEEEDIGTVCSNGYDAEKPKFNTNSHNHFHRRCIRIWSCYQLLQKI